jgi:hypothetical protein
MLLGHLFVTLVPFGDPAFRMNLLGAITGASAVASMYVLARGFSVGPIIAAAASLTLGLEQAFWRTSVRADPHPLHLVLALLLIGLVLAWHRRGHPFGLVALAAFISGLALGNHLLTALLAPGLVVFVISCQPGLLQRPLRLVKLAGAALAGAAIYVYVPIDATLKAPLTVDYSPDTWSEFWRYVFGGDFHTGMGFLTLDGPAHAVAGLPTFIGNLGAEFTIPIVITLLGLAAAGCLVLAIHGRRELALLLLCGGLTLYAALTFDDSDIERYYFVPIAVVILLAAIGAQELLSVDRASEALRRTARVAPVLALVVPVGLASWNLGRVQPTSAQCFATTFLRDVRPHAGIVSWWGYSTPLWYEIQVSGVRRDVSVWNGLDGATGQVAEWFGERPVYVIQPDQTISTLAADYALVRHDACGFGYYEVTGRKTAADNLGR